MEKKFKTEFQVRLLLRNDAICKDFKKLKEENELASSWRVCSVLSEKYNLTAFQVSNIVRAAGIYERRETK